MADQTKKELRNKLMYQVFVRNYTEEGTFDGVRRDLDRIRDLGVDIVYLLPIHPIGEKCRKGSLGSPYAISDYRAVNPEYGTLEDFRALADAVHEKGMKIIIDVVYNHTSPDSVLSVEHPEWFYRKEDGSFGNHVGDWSDIIDLDYTREGLAEYQIETLKYWAGMVDGFRCDVAPFLPLSFWEKARKEVAEVNPDCLWLSESVEPAFIREMRDRGLGVLSEQRDGGQDHHTAPDVHDPYVINVKTNRYEAYMKHAFIIDPEHGTNIAVMGNASLHQLDAQYGKKDYNVDQKNAYAQLMFETNLTQQHNLSAGLSLNHDYLTRNEKETTPGAYAQYTFNLNDKVVAMAGLRADHSSVYGTFVTPRFHLKLTPNEVVNLRLSAGKGYRTVHALAENNYLLSSGRQLVIDDLEQERAWNYGVSSSFYIPLFGKTLKLNAE